MDAENPRAVAGGNAPPDPLLAEAAERVDSANRWLQERADWTTWDAELADKANFFIGQISATFKALDERRKDENREWLAKQDVIYKDPLTLLDMAKGKLAPLRRLWLQREEEKVQETRRKAEAEAAAAREAAAKAAAAAATAKNKLEAELAAAKAQAAAAQAEQAIETLPERATIKGAYSTKATGLRTVWKAKITNLSDALRSYKKNPHVVKAIEEAILRAATQHATLEKDPAKAPKGVEFYSEKL